MAEEPSKLDISDEMIAERRGGSNKMPNDMPRWMANSIIRILERTCESALIFFNINFYG